MFSGTWAIVLATFLGPIVAILITRWRDIIREQRMRRMYVFRTLLATRRQAITQEHVTALNLIEIDFYGVPSVENDWKTYHNHLNSAPRGRLMTIDENKAFEEKRNELLAKLIYAIARFLKFTMSEIDIKNGGYAPQGWSNKEDRASKIQDFAIELANGSRGLPITLLAPIVNQTTAK